ncbi:hypothetical protein [Methylobacterium sp. AMS5]|uniref:hypothetical protein n=1 Tax=Methylobacterium sp. AMS5 TaxID=925818 RepID=UPI00074F9D1B|nr:hypothetical protein [Methylobacterium sp. AMS5]AMB48335.1 hypothetical protein Y590_25540 [Methylobacterium sp. AMS5]
MDVNTNTAALNVDQNADIDLLLADLDIDEGDIQEIEAVADAAPEQTEVREEPVVEEPVEEMIEAGEAAADTETVSMEATEIEGGDDEAIVASGTDTPETEVTEDLADAIGAEIEVEEQRDAIYAEQPADDTSLDADAAATAAAAKPAKAVKKTSAGTGRVRQGLNDLPAEIFVLTDGEAPADLAAHKAAVIAACPAQKKVREKFENLLVSVANERLPSTYTQIAFRALAAAPGGEMTGVELTNALKATGLGEGTARSQSGQMMALFPALKIAVRSGNKIKLHDKSVLAAALKILMSL